MTQIEKIVIQLDQHLTESLLYEADFGRSEEISALILFQWENRFKEAAHDDFNEYQNLNVMCTDCHFELFADQGATVWTMRLEVGDETADPKLSFWIKSVINYRLSKAFLEEACIRQPHYNGSNNQARALFKKLKDSVEDGYESTIQIGKLLSN